MKSAQVRRTRPAKTSLDEALAGATKSFKEAHLRALMKQREEVVEKLVNLDFSIWALEEFFRTAPQV